MSAKIEKNAVEWLEEKIIKEGNYKQKTILMELFEQAKKIHKEQIEKLRPKIISNCKVK
jgi:hypothetical protein